MVVVDREIVVVCYAFILSDYWNQSMNCIEYWLTGTGERKSDF